MKFIFRSLEGAAEMEWEDEEEKEEEEKKQWEGIK